jgi:hypothetical protein
VVIVATVYVLSQKGWGVVFRKVAEWDAQRAETNRLVAGPSVRLRYSASAAFLVPVLVAVIVGLALGNVWLPFVFGTLIGTAGLAVHSTVWFLARSRLEADGYRW